MSALVSASLCSSDVGAISAAGWAGVGLASLAAIIGIPTTIICACSGKKVEKKPGTAVPALDKVAPFVCKPFVPSIFDRNEISDELLHDSLKWGPDLEHFIIDCVGKKNFKVLKEFSNVYCHGNIVKDRLDINKILEMSFERVGSGMEGVKVLSNGEIANFLSNPSNEEDVEFAYYAMARCLDVFHESVTYEKLRKVVRKDCVGFRFRSGDEDLRIYCSVFINREFIELWYRSSIDAFRCIIRLN